MQDKKNIPKVKNDSRDRHRTKPKKAKSGGVDPLVHTLETSNSKAWSERRKNAEIVADKLEEAGFHKRAARMRACLRYVQKVDHSCGHPGYTSTSVNGVNVERCRDRLCPMCNHIDADKASRELTAVLPPHISRHGLYPHFLTLTYLNREKLVEFDATTMNRQMKRLLQSDVFEPYGYYGAYWALEVHDTIKGQWHPHYHVLLLTEKPIPLIESGKRIGNWQNDFNQAVSDEWFRITKDSIIVKGLDFNGNMRELTKYMHKGVQCLNKDKLEELAKWSKGVRRCGYIGKLYNNPEIKAAREQHGIDERLKAGDGPTCKLCGCNEYVVTLLRWNGSAYVPDRVLSYETHETYEARAGP